MCVLSIKLDYHYLVKYKIILVDTWTRFWSHQLNQCDIAQYFCFVLFFQQRLQRFAEVIDIGNLDNFESSKKYKESSGWIIDFEYLKSAIQSMKNSFSKSTLEFLTSPLTAETRQIHFHNLYLSTKDYFHCN